MRKNLKDNNKGITLIALAITIIVLVILAGVSITALKGDNGIINEAKDAKTSNEKAQVQEEIELATIQALKNDNNTISKMKDYLKIKFPSMKIDTVTTTYIRFDYKDQDIVVDDTGKVTVIEKVEPDNTEEWNFDSRTGTLTCIEGTTFSSGNIYENLVIPNYYKGQKVKIFNTNDDYFGNICNVKAKKVILSDGIEKIGEKALGELKAEEIYLSKTLLTIGRLAISHNYIKELSIPKSVENIEVEGIGYNDLLQTIKCERSSDSGWNESWNKTNANVVYGYNQ